MISWIIAGGESGPGARECDVTWIRSIVQQCQAAEVPLFVKQLGARPVGAWGGANNPFFVHHWRLNDRKGGDMEEFPEDLRVREFPEALHAGHR